MKQEQFLARRDELARKYHLGALEMYRTPMTLRGRVILGAVIGGLALLAFIVFGAYVLAQNPNGFHEGFPLILLLPFFVYLIVFSLIPFYSLLSDSERYYVYVYTNGLVWLWPEGGRVVHWGEINKVGRDGYLYSRNGYFFIKLNEGYKIRVPGLRSRGSASYDSLKWFIEGKIHPRENGPYGAPPYGQP